MGRLFGMIMRVAVWAASGAALAFVGMLFYQAFTEGGPMAIKIEFGRSASVASIGAAVGGVIGFFKRG